MDSAEDALRQMIACCDLRASVVAVDSAINRGIASREVVMRLLERTARGRQVARHVDPKAESGLETLARLALRRLQLRVRTQVKIAGVGRVDLLIGDRLVLELDGEAWHDRPGDFEEDRRRDRALVVAGYLVLRASYRQVMDEWQVIERQIVTIVRSGRHRWPAGRR
jgi:very-short-patch-repair endonuclease